MEAKKIFEKYYSRLALEGFLKALVLGLIAGFAAEFIVAFVTWMVSFNGLWISIAAGVVVAAGVTALLYFKKFRPTAKQIARRVDRLGLEERLITMTELEGDDSYIALRQREDAQAKMREVEAKAIKLRLSKLAIAFAAVFMALGVSMTTITGLAASGEISGGDDFFEDVFPEPPVYFEVSYIADDGGEILENADQIVLKGDDALPVLAIPDDGYMFAGWSDELEKNDPDYVPDPARTDLNVQQDIIVHATFMLVQEGEGQGGGNGEESDKPQEGQDGEGDQPSDAPSQDQSDSGSDGEQQDQDSQQGQDGQPGQEPGQDGDGAGGQYEENNQIWDGDTYYRDLLDEYLAKAQEYLENNEDLPPELRDIIESYFDIIE